MLRFNPDARPTAMEALQNDWFADVWDTPIGRLAATPTDGEENPLNMLEESEKIKQRPSSAASHASSFELPFDTSQEEVNIKTNQLASLPMPYSTPGLKSIPVNSINSNTNSVKELKNTKMNTNNNVYKLSDYQEKQWDSHQQSQKQFQQQQHYQNQLMHASILERNASFTNPFQKHQPLPSLSTHLDSKKSSMSPLSKGTESLSSFKSIPFTDFSSGSSPHASLQSIKSKPDLGPVRHPSVSPIKKKKPFFGFLHSSSSPLSHVKATPLTVEGIL